MLMLHTGSKYLFPIQATEGTYIDKKCPFTGNVAIRGRILRGVVMKLKMQRTIVIRRDYLHYVKKYNRFEKRHKNMSVHLSPAFRLVYIFSTLSVAPKMMKTHDGLLRSDDTRLYSLN